jgi:hypothetical protein
MDYDSLRDAYHDKKELVSFLHFCLAFMVIGFLVSTGLIIWQAHQNEQLKAEVAALKIELNQKENK